MSIQQDPWLGEMLGKPACHIVAEPLKLVVADLPEGEAFTDARVDVRDFKALSHLQGLGFAVIDCNVSLERPGDMRKLEVDSPSGNIRFAESKDELGVRALAKEAFEYDRFHRDPRVSDDVANRIKEEWAGNFFTGDRGTWMVIATDEKGVAGFMLLLSLENGALVIDLVAVAARCRRRGVAQSMTDFALGNCTGKMPRIRVGTQLSNSPSLRLYEAMGFRWSGAAYVLHRHNESL